VLSHGATARFPVAAFDAGPQDRGQLRVDRPSATHATSALKKIHSVLNRAIKHAQRRDKVGRNVAALIEEVPEGKPGRPSKSMSPEQVKAVFKASKGTWFHSYLVVSNMTGIHTEEVRPLEWKRTHLNPIKGERCTCDQQHVETGAL
jgi:hypothetical protein